MSPASVSAVQAESDTLGMFFDPEFDPNMYVDSIFQLARTKSSIGSLGTSSKGLSDLSNQISGLIAHLDYYTNELSTNLQQKFELLNTNSNLIGENDTERGTTRLQYYVNVLSNSIVSLQSELASVDAQLDSSNQQPDSAVQDLVSLKKVKANLVSVLEVYELVSTVLSRDDAREEHTSLSPEEFQARLTEFAAKLETSEPSVAEKVDQLLDIGNLFGNMSKFGSIYRQFLSKLSTERDNIKKTSV